MTSDTTILNMLREVRDLNIPVPAMWARNFNRTPEQISAWIEMVRAERMGVAA